MLAVSPITAPHESPTSTQTTWTLGQTQLAAAQIPAFVSLTADGGFIPDSDVTTPVTGVVSSSDIASNWQLPNSYQDIASDGLQNLFSAPGKDTVLTRAWNVASLVGVSFSPTSSVALNISAGYVVPTNFDTSVGSTSLSNQSLYDGPSRTVAVDLAPIQPAVIVPEMSSSESGPISPFDMKPVVIGPRPNEPGPSLPGEGGSIPIHAIFADFRQDGHLASGVKSVSSLLTEASIDLQASAHTPSTSDDAVAGEWARATVFEIAGGEPGDLTSGGGTSKASSNVDTLQNDPLSTIDHSRQSKTHRATESSQADGTDGQVGQEAHPEGAIVADDTANPANPTGQASDHGLAASTSLADSMQLSETNVTGAANPEAAAIEAVFRRLGEDKNAVVESNLHGKSWLHSIGTSPLLIALALERLAALNSRRARREAKTSPAKGAK